MTPEQEKELKLIPIPTIEDYDQFERNRAKANMLNEESCPCCGKVLLNPKFFFNSAYGGMAYLASDKNDYPDCWVMAVGTECRKRFPEGYVFTK